MRNKKKQKEIKQSKLTSVSDNSPSVVQTRVVPNALYQIIVPSSKVGLVTIIPSVLDEIKNDRDMLQAISYAFSSARTQGYSYDEWVGLNKKEFLRKLVMANIRHIEHFSDLLGQSAVEQSSESVTQSHQRSVGVESVWEGII